MSWIDQLPDDLKGNESLTSYETVGDFASAHLETLGKVTDLDGKATEYEGKITDLEGRFANTIPKLTDTSTDDDRAAYNLAIGVPADKAEYEFPKTEGIEQDEKMMNFARDMFHAAGVSKEAAAKMVPLWDNYQSEMGKALEESQLTAEKEAVTAAETALKEEWKADFDENKKVAERGYQAFEKIVPGFGELLALETKTGITIGNDPRMMKMFNAVGKAIGDDLSFPIGDPSKGNNSAPKPGLQSLYGPNPTPTQ